MASIKISQLTAAASATGTQEFEINDSGTSKKVTGTQIKTFVKDGLVISDLTGVTTTAVELNYVDGVTSAIQTQLNAKAELASPALTGTPTAPTAAVGTNTTQIATTAFALANIGISNVNIQVFTASGTYTPTSGYKWGIAFVTGGGGGGMGRGNTDGTTDGAGAGGTAIGVLNLTTLGSVAATVGAGGVGGGTTPNAGANAGTNAGNSTLSTLTGNGAQSDGSTGATASGGIINITGGDGSDSLLGTALSIKGTGGASFWGGGGTGHTAARAYGAGAGGNSSTISYTGANGMSGVIVIMEFK